MVCLLAGDDIQSTLPAPPVIECHLAWQPGHRQRDIYNCQVERRLLPCKFHWCAFSGDQKSCRGCSAAQSHNLHAACNTASVQCLSACHEVHINNVGVRSTSWSVHACSAAQLHNLLHATPPLCSVSVLALKCTSTVWEFVSPHVSSAHGRVLP
jgi:hypothetical protein